VVQSSSSEEIDAHEPSRRHTVGLPGQPKRLPEGRTARDPDPSGFDKVSEWANRARAVPLAEITAVEPCRRSSIKITTRDHESREFAVGAGRIAPVWAPENIAARDELLAAIEAARGR